MQKPFTIAVVGNGSSASSWNTSQPSLTNAIMSAGDLKRVNSATSAPAMKPSFAERITRPLGEEFFISVREEANSLKASLENVFADSPCLSKVSQARPTLSFSQRH